MYEPDVAIRTARIALQGLRFHPGPAFGFPMGARAHALITDLPAFDHVEPVAASLARGDTEITELENPKVHSLRIVNRGRQPVYLPVGTTLKGGGQNRMISVPIIVEAGSTREIDVNCVERGRWTAERHARFVGLSTSPSSIKRAKLAREHRNRSTNRRSNDQINVWRDVSERLDTLGIRSPTEDLTESVELPSHPWQRQVREAWMGASGCLVARRRGVLGLDAWGATTVRDAELEQTLFAYALDFGLPKARPVEPRLPAFDRALDRLREADRWSVRQSGDAALVDFRCGRGRLGGSAVVYGERLIHLSIVPARSDA